VRKIITLLSDFGSNDSYVAQMKGVVLGICPDVNIVDVTHSIEPYDIMRAAVALAQAYAYFPPGTVHLAVVDPGVGTGRRGIVAVSRDYVFVGPDNGIFSLVYKELKDFTVYNITNEKLFFKRPGATFHGRDVFAPVSARICAGAAPSEAGAQIDDYARLDIPDAKIHLDAGSRAPNKGHIEGIVLYLDRFGNAATNIEESLLPKTIAIENLRIACKGRRGVFKSCYAEGACGELCALTGSFRRIELFVNRGNAGDALGIKTGDKVEIFF
jgi:hypothetical protein